MSMTNAADARSQAVSPVSIFSMPDSLRVTARAVSRGRARVALRFGTGEERDIGARDDTVPAPKLHPSLVYPHNAQGHSRRALLHRSVGVAMTAVVNWRGDSVRRHDHLPLPPPPRDRHVSKAVPLPKDPTGQGLEGV